MPIETSHQEDLAFCCVHHKVVNKDGPGLTLFQGLLPFSHPFSLKPNLLLLLTVTLFPFVSYCQWPAFHSFSCCFLYLKVFFICSGNFVLDYFPDFHVSTVKLFGLNCLCSTLILFLFLFELSSPSISLLNQLNQQSHHQVIVCLRLGMLFWLCCCSFERFWWNQQSNIFTMECIPLWWRFWGCCWCITNKW